MLADDEAIFEAVVFLDHFPDLPDPRQLIKVIYPLDEALQLSLLAGLARQRLTCVPDRPI